MDADGGISDNYRMGETVAKNALDTQYKLDQIRLKLMQARAQKASLKNVYGNKGLPYKEITSEGLQKLTEERTRTFLDFKSVQAALRAAEANKALTVALNLEAGDDVNLEAEEETYVRELLEEQTELSKALMKYHEVGVQQDFEIIEARSELAGYFFKYQQLRNEAGPLLFGSEDKDENMKQLEMETQHEEYRLHQIRLIIQKLMMSEEKYGMLFDDETNEKFKKMFYRCGMTPEELRSDLLDQTAMEDD